MAKSPKNVKKSAQEVVNDFDTKYPPKGHATQFDTVVNEVVNYTRLGMNVMLVGQHGVGKTAAIQAACKQEGWDMWYASAPLLDPDIDLGGIPVPNRDTGALDFFTQPKLFDAEVLFLDELNRASPRTLNMVFELIQFKSVHGKKLPKLRAVHTGINPPGAGQYDVQKLDDALMDRFHAFIYMKPEFPRPIIEAVLGHAYADAMNVWYQEHLTDVYVSPRRLEYVAQLFKAGMPIEQSFNDPKVPVGRLREMLASVVMADTGVVVQEPVALQPIWMEKKFQDALKDPAKKVATEQLTKYMEEFCKEFNFDPKLVWDAIAERRKQAAEKK